MRDVQLQYCAVDAMLTISKVGREPDMRWTHERETCVMGISVCTAPLADASGRMKGHAFAGSILNLSDTPRAPDGRMCLDTVCFRIS